MFAKSAAVCLVLLAACQAIPAAEAPQGDGPLLGGLAAVDITPPVPYRMSGYFHERLSDGVLDPLRAKAMMRSQETIASFCPPWASTIASMGSAGSMPMGCLSAP